MNERYSANRNDEAFGDIHLMENNVTMKLYIISSRMSAQILIV